MDWLSTWWRDVRHGLRALQRRPSYSLAAVATLGLGIGVCTATFSVLHGVVFRPLPYQDPARIVRVWETYPQWQDRPVLQESWDRIPLAWPDFVQWREGRRSFAQVAAYGATEMTTQFFRSSASIPSRKPLSHNCFRPRATLPNTAIFPTSCGSSTYNRTLLILKHTIFHMAAPRLTLTFRT